MALRPLAFVRLFLVPLGASAALWQMASAAAAPVEPAADAGSMTQQLSQVRSGHYQMDREHARLFWTVSHRGFSLFKAAFADLHGTLNFDASAPTHSQLDAIVDMNSVATLLPAFDKELKGEQYFNTAKYSTAEFKSTQIALSGHNRLRVSGTLTFLGVTKPVVLEAHFNQAGILPTGYRVGFDGRLAFKRSDFGMPRSTIGDAVTLDIEAEFEPASAVSPAP